MTELQSIRLIKKAKKYPHQLSDSEILYLNQLILLAEALEIKTPNEPEVI